jgi:hypothetical protein
MSTLHPSVTVVTARLKDFGVVGVVHPIKEKGA